MPSQAPFPRNPLPRAAHCTELTGVLPNTPICYPFSSWPTHCTSWVKMVRVWGLLSNKILFRKRQ